MKIQVFGQPIQIQFVKGLSEATHHEGEYHPKAQVIRIDASLSKEDTIRTLIHEIGHAIFHRCGLNQAIHYQLEEVVVETFATALYESLDIKMKRQKK